MEIRRRIVTGQLVTETRGTPSDPWRPSPPPDVLGPSPFRPEWEAWSAQAAGARDDDVVLPLTPLTVRTFSVSERHNTQAARGYLERFHPRTAVAARWLHALTGRTLPGLRPGRLWYRQPTYFMSNPVTFVPSGVDVAFPSFSTALDYEAQLACVLGAPLLDASPEQAERAVAAFVLICDFSARDVQIAEMATRLGPQKGKHFLSSMAATAITTDEVLPTWGDLTGTVRVNGDVVARPTTRGHRWSLGELLAHASRSERLVPGEVFSTGSLADGSGMEVGRWLRPGDLLELDVPGVGAIVHRIRAAPTA